MKRIIPLIALLASIAAMPAHAVPITYEIDGDGLSLGGALVNGYFTYETDTFEMVDVAFNVTGAGSRDGTYSLLVHQYAMSWVVARDDASLGNLTGAFALGFDILDDLSAGGTVSGSMTALVTCPNAGCYNLSILETPYQSSEPGSYTSVGTGTQPDPVSVPEPTALPLLATGMILLTVAGLRRRRAAARL